MTSTPQSDPAQPETAFVLGGGGVLGAVEVGMLRALLERGIVPDLVLGTSIGALNGAWIAKDPSMAAVERMGELWRSVGATGAVYSGGAIKTVRRAVSTKTNLYSPLPLITLLRDEFGDLRLEDLAVRFQVCASHIETSSEHWFTHGPVVDAVIASAAVPGLLPPAQVDGQHYLDGGIVNSIPLGRAVELGARRVFVLQVGRVDRPLSVPTKPWEVARVSFEIARRHRFVRELGRLPDDVEAHVLPAAGTSEKDDTMKAYRDFSSVERRIEATHQACLAYLDERSLGGSDATGPDRRPIGHPDTGAEAPGETGVTDGGTG